MLVGMWLAGGIGAAARRVGGGPSAVQWPRDVRWAADVELAMAERRGGIGKSVHVIEKLDRPAPGGVFPIEADQARENI